MQRICKNCFNFIDRKYQICPICHKPVKGKEKVKPEKNVVEVNRFQPVAKVVTVDYTERKKWIPKYKRRGYKKQQEYLKGQSIRVQGRHIDVSKISIFEAGNKNKYKARTAGTYNDYKKEKLEWWEIYKKADRWLVKRKLNKVVTMQAKVRPEKCSYWVMVILSLFTGFLGLHSFYAKNYKRGIVSVSLFAWSISLVALMGVFPWLVNVQYSLIAFPALICMLMWLWDAVAVIFKRYIYSQSKLEFIYSLDVETRAWLGNKYIMVPNWFEYKG